MKGSYEGIDIEGPKRFILQTKKALELIKIKDCYNLKKIKRLLKK